MKNSYSIFDIVGPIMIGPSSSHTAGANRIAGFARKIGGKGYTKAEFYLHGSFAKTYRGHGTDRALVGGVLGFGPDDERIVDSFKYASEEGLTYTFLPTDLGDVHPNTVKIVLTYPDHTFSLTGCSIGGGNIKIININGNNVEFYGKNPTIICTYPEQKGMIAFISNALYDEGYNIHSMKTIQNEDEVMLIVELDEKLNEDLQKKISKGKNFGFFKYLD
ncbi:MAG: L-serine ammonia-lyase, iron-sulfur-dependent subunit beta [Peptoniphilaceae bacterium]|nr:L-serine ammonia-lyase, iron-sulfur-dependent subunit beta [Peptoniphilaceae bacterium]MDD7383258.1 L-serine ammonia-lyase, iron-sulfur-dependent subunit beta [Peptoniphilaceae bacterium]MDY3737985.1 L-serine ammonia-lyase, iron-sulfur-dependent subunit beta [Peptoniphilaceae bacterium]